MDIFLNYIFVCWKDHKWSIIVWIVMIFLEYLSSIAKLTCSKFDTNQTFLHLQSTQTLKMDNPCFCQMSFFTTKCAPLLKIGEDFNIDDEKDKRTWTNFYNQFEHIWLKSVFDLKNYGFWKFAFNKSCSCLCNRGNIHDI